jgi:hypothetical protein
MKMKSVGSGIGQVYIREALQKAENCFLCYLENRFEQRYLDNYLTYLVMDAGERERIIESRGFCNYHFHKMHALSTNPTGSDGLGMALILKSVTEQLLDDVKSQQPAKSVWSRRPRLRLKGNSHSILASRLLKTVANQTKCPACNHVSTMMQVYTHDFLQQAAEDEEILKLYDTSKGMCIPHYAVALLVASRISDERCEYAIQRIIHKQIRVLERTQIDLSEYIEKQDYHFSQKDRAGTEEAVGESLAEVAGRRGTDRTLATIIEAKCIE